MIKTISTVVAAFAVVTFAGLSGNASAQSCSSCNSAGSFSYPVDAGSCGGGGCLGKGHGRLSANVQDFRAQLDHQAALNEKIAARNDAWPKPFACQDRRDYYAVWRPMLAVGNEVQAVMDQSFFTEDNELNRVGIDRVKGIALNNPASERAVYLSRSSDQATDQARLTAIRHTINTYYSHRGVVDVRLSDRVPATITAASSQLVTQSYGENKPPATIADVESVTTAVTQ